MPDHSDSAVRTAVFAFLEREVIHHQDGILPWRVLTRGIDWNGRRVPLVSQQGIFKPAVCELPISIRTTAPRPGVESPYEDEVSGDGMILYRYRGTDTAHRENEGLRRAMRDRVPLVYLYGVVPGEYLALWPTFVVHDDPGSLCFTVAVDDHAIVADGALPGNVAEAAAERRKYITGTAQRRVHQQSFRHRVLLAYKARCAVCSLRHRELLDAAHILPDRHPKGTPVVPNGLSLCKLHHAAYDGNIIGVRPDYTVAVRTDILKETDGPMLKHGLQGFEGSRILAPKSEALRPDRERLAERYEEFRAA